MNQTLPSTSTALPVQDVVVGRRGEARWALLRLIVAATLTVAALAIVTALAG